MPLFEYMRKFVTLLYNVFIAPFYGYGTGHRPLQNGRDEEIVQNNVWPVSGALNRGGGEDTIDSGDAVDSNLSGDLKNSLEKVSKAIYKKFVSDWHTPPEELQNQPLYKEINSGIQTVFLNIKHKARPLEEYEIIISIANAFIAHFKNKRKNKVTYRSFKTRQEEVDFVRKNIKCLLDFWLPESMQRSPLIYVFITEILSVNVLEPIINSYSEFTNINEAIVEALDDNRPTQHKEDPGKCDEVTIGSRPSGSYTVMEKDGISYRKKGFKRRCKDFMKAKISRNSECMDGPVFRSCIVGDVIDMDSTDDDEDDEISMTFFIDTSLQMWLQNNWTAKVSERFTEKEDEYKISVYDESAPNTELWNTKRRVEDFKLIYEKMCQKYPDFINSAKEKSTGGATSEVDRQFFLSIGATPDEFINILLNLVKKHKETEVVFFFSPCEDKDDVGEDLSDEENSSEQSNTDDESTRESSSVEMGSDNSGSEYRTFKSRNKKKSSNKFVGGENPSSSYFQDINKCEKDDRVLENSFEADNNSNNCYQADGIKFPRSRKKNKKDKSASHSEDIPSTRVTGGEESPVKNTDMRNFGHAPFISIDSNPQRLAHNGLNDLISQNSVQIMEQRKQKLQETLLYVLYQLIDEVLLGGISGLRWLHSIGILKKKSKDILDSIPNIYAEEQIIWCLSQIELLMCQVRPQQLPPDVLQSKALDLLKNKVQGFLTSSLVKFFCKKQMMNNVKAFHQALQDPLANKATIYRILEDLTKVITGEGDLK